MPAHHPEQLDQLFSEALNAGNLDALMNLYESEAVLKPQPGQAVQGRSSIRDALGAFIDMKAQISLSPKTLGQAGDLALTSSRWELKGVGPDGTPVQMTGHSVEVARKQPDGTWLFAIDTPWGLEWEA
jgi:ketosteroid isomerase-like protein